MLKLNNIQVTLNKNTRLANQILHNTDLMVANGEFVIIVGNNGCGKSTLFNTIAGFVTPEQGSIEIDSVDVSKQSATQRAAAIALVLQDPQAGTIANMTIEENLSLAFKRGKKRGVHLCHCAQRQALFKEYLAMLYMDLENRLHELVGNLSGGQRQALSLIMAIIADYKILLLDEITAALDPKTADTVMAIAAKLVTEQKRTAIMITHNMQYALQYGHRTLIMQRGGKFCEYTQAMRSALTPQCLAAVIGAY